MTKPNKPYGIIWSHNVHFVTISSFNRDGSLVSSRARFFIFLESRRVKRSLRFPVIYICMISGVSFQVKHILSLRLAKPLLYQLLHHLLLDQK